MTKLYRETPLRCHAIMQPPVTMPQTTNYDAVVLTSPKVFQALSISQLLAAIINIIYGVTALANSDKVWIPTTEYATGAQEVWTPVPFVISGVLGLLFGRVNARWLVIAHMVLCIISAFFSFVLFINACVYSYVLVPQVTLGFLAFAEFSISIILCTLCYQALCCKNYANPCAITQAAAPQSDALHVGLPVTAIPRKPATADLRCFGHKLVERQLKKFDKIRKA